MSEQMRSPSSVLSNTDNAIQNTTQPERYLPVAVPNETTGANSTGRMETGGGGYAPEDDVHSLKNLPEHDVLAVEPSARGGGDKKLTAVRIRP